MNKEIPEKCCANCKHLLPYPRNNSHNDVDYLCVKLSRFISGRYIDIEKVQFFLGDGKTVDKRAKEKCVFEKKEGK